MKARRHVLAWLGLVLPTLAVGALAFWLLGREQARLDALARESARAQARTVADNLDLIMAEIKTGVMQALEAASGPGDEQARLRELAASNPFVETFAIWNPESVRETEMPAAGASTDAPQLVRPFLSANATAPWQPEPPSSKEKKASQMEAEIVAPAEGAAPVAAAVPSEEEQAPRTYDQAKASRQSIREISQQNVQALNTLKVQEVQEARREDVRQAPAAPTASGEPSAYVAAADMADVAVQRSGAETVAVAEGHRRRDAQSELAGQLSEETDEPQAFRFLDADSADAPALSQASEPLLQQPTAFDELFESNALARSGWMERSDGAPGWLAWYQREPGDRITGVVLNVPAVLEQFQGAFPKGEYSGRLLAPDGSTVYAPRSKYDYLSSEVYSDMDTLPVGEELSGWRLGVTVGSASGGRGYLLLGGLLVAALCASTLGAGTLLLLQARRDAREAARKTTFVSNVSHELRTPLTTIRMYAEMLEEGRVADTDKRGRYLATITAETQRLSRLVDNVLDFSRLEQGRKKYRREPVDMAEVVASVLEAQAPRLREAQMVVEWAPPVVAVKVETDRDALGQVLLNLVDNALKYAAAGKLLRLSLTSDDRQARLRVEDRGPGIPARDRERVFKAFQRLDESLTAATPGSGLGLSICRGLLRDLGGEIELVPGEKSGCCFTITLPLVKS
ncbi:MAG: HAMP domain-containing sensor histidine kinase [Verrucomicrobiota bacterium JB024]|nr:HAMP domain-containing sensor histidine kinase [Verrucomicrobiota bacterium JB024]